MVYGDNGGPAFPSKSTDQDGREWFTSGMSLRDYFAAQALMGLLANGLESATKKESEAIVDRAYRIATQMLERKQS